MTPAQVAAFVDQVERVVATDPSATTYQPDPIL